MHTRVVYEQVYINKVTEELQEWRERKTRKSVRTCLPFFAGEESRVDRPVLF